MRRIPDGSKTKSPVLFFDNTFLIFPAIKTKTRCYFFVSIPPSSKRYGTSVTVDCQFDEAISKACTPVFWHDNNRRYPALRCRKQPDMHASFLVLQPVLWRRIWDCFPDDTFFHGPRR